MENNNKSRICLSPLISDGMVLQRGDKGCYMGRAVPGQDLALNFRQGL